MRIDLHTHSAVSDGTDTPTELVAAAVAAGLDVIAITDHDTTASWAEAADAAHVHDITVIRGSEISTQLDGSSIHLLGYLFDPDHAELAAELDKISRDRIPRLRRMTELAGTELGSRVTWEQVVAEAGGADSVGRPHLADAMVAIGEARSREDAFERLIGSRSPAYVPKYAPNTFTMITMLLDAGGVPVIAHPWARAVRGRLDIPTLERLRDAGLVGLEVDHLDHDDRTREDLREVVADLGLVPTGSSDYHGTGKSGYRLGICTTSPHSYEAILAAVGPNGVDPIP
jgi:predicted metal-dependent phosphoesterase TrpH